jgi:hypothetical protein
MTSALLCIAAFAAAYFSAKRSLAAGLIVVMGLGYAYGIVRANIAETYSHLIFDAAVLGLYAVWLIRPFTASERHSLHDVRLWVIALIAWPTALFLFFRQQDPLIEMVGLRGNVFFLPFVLLGARLAAGDIHRLALALAGLNFGATILAAAQHSLGLEIFLPYNEVTELIYRSNDVAGYTAYRIPSSFVSAHAYAGTMVATIPFLIGAWQQGRRHWFEGYVFPGAVVVALIGISMSAVRTHAVVAALLVVAVTFSRKLGVLRSARWLITLALVAWVVAGDVRLQRVATLADLEAIRPRVSASVNWQFMELMGEYPMGVGLAGGGSSIPHFLEERLENRVGLENEYARIAMEQGMPGLFIWLLFALWFVSRFPRETEDSLLGRRLAWIALVAFLALAVTGIGLLTAIPQTPLLLLGMGWVARRRRPPAAEGVEVEAAQSLESTASLAR